jgi:heavy metal sensor kinase
MRQWWQHRTLRFRLAVWYAAGGTILLTAFSATLYSYVSLRMARPLDHELRRDLGVIQQRLQVLPDDTVSWNGAGIGAQTNWTTEYPWFELWNQDGTLVRRFWPFAENRVQQVPSAPVRGRETISVFSVAPDLRLRVLSVPYSLPGRSPAWMIRVMRVHEPVADSLDDLRWIIALALPIVIALLVLGGYIITRRWLSPLDRMALEAERITADDLGRRLPIAEPRGEIGRLAAVFNDTLDRLERSFVALDRFASDASHELRTPLTTLRSVGEVGLRRSRSVEEYREIIGSMLEEAQRLQALIHRLLELASAESGSQSILSSEIKLDDAVRTWVSDLAILAENKHQRLTVTASPCVAHTDPLVLRQALQNLVDNAIKYSPEGGSISVTVQSTASSCEITVTDDGPGIAPPDRPLLAERFFRPGGARDRNSGGFGLGLAITKAYMRALRGSMEYRPIEPHGSTFILTVPCA